MSTHRTGKPRKMGELLVEAGILTQEQLEIALAEQRRTRGKLGSILIDLGIATEEAISRVLASQTGVDHYDLESLQFETAAVELIPHDLARRRQCVPIRLDKGTLVVAMANPADIMAIDELERASDAFVHVVAASRRQVLRAIDRAYAHVNARETSLESAIRLAAEELAAEAGVQGGSGVVALVEEILGQALRRDATDVHFEPDKHVVRVRFRVDGDLMQGPTMPGSLLPAVVARVKVLAHLDISESRIPQDGKVHFTWANRSIDLRVSTFPCVNGESVVIRILDRSRQSLVLSALGLSVAQVEVLRAAVKRPNGLILAAGPTGSGKTTTLYALLREVDTARRKVITLEDPVEYDLPLSSQCQINERSGLTFATGLRAILRHDPDVILVGEMRDTETSEMAFRAALTGHLVFSTVHTNDAVRTAARLQEMGIEPFLVASCLAAVSAQRLVRLICSQCRVPYEPREDELVAVGLDPQADGSFAKGEGCERCHGTGIRGREALFEVMEVTPAVAEVIGRGGRIAEIEAAAREAGLVSFRQQACEKARQGSMALDEVARVTADY